MSAPTEMTDAETAMLSALPKNATAKIEKRKSGVSEVGEHLEAWDTLTSSIEIHIGARAASVQSISSGQRQLTTWNAIVPFDSRIDVSCRFTISGKFLDVRSVRPSFASVFQSVELVEVA